MGPLIKNELTSRLLLKKLRLQWNQKKLKLSEYRLSCSSLSRKLIDDWQRKMKKLTMLDVMRHDLLNRFKPLLTTKCERVVKLFARERRWSPISTTLKCNLQLPSVKPLMLKSKLKTSLGPSRTSTRNLMIRS